MKRNKKWVILPIFSGAIWLWFYLAILSPNLRQGKLDFYIACYGHLGRNVPEIARSIITHPIKILRFMTVPYKLKYLFDLFGPLSFFSFFSPLILLIPLPIFLQHLVSIRLTEVTLFYYYPSEFLAFIFISAIFGLKSLLKFNLVRHKKIYYIFMPTVALFFSISLGPQLNILPKMKLECKEVKVAVQNNHLLSLIPKDASVVSTFEFLPKLSNITDRLYSLHHIILGKYYSNKEFQLPKDVEYALINFNDMLTFYNFFVPPQGQQNLMDFFKENFWGPIEAVENTVLFKKNYKGNLSLFETVKFLPKENLKSVNFDNDIELVSSKIENSILTNRDNIHLTFFWQALKKIDKNYWLVASLLDSNSKIIYDTIHPLCYRIHPTNTWKEKEIVKEEYYISIPLYLSKGNYQIYAGIFDFSTGKIGKIISDNIEKKNNWWIKLADIQVK